MTNATQEKPRIAAYTYGSDAVAKSPIRLSPSPDDHGRTVGHIRARDLIAFSAAIVVPMKPFLARKGHPDAVAACMTRGGRR